MLAYSHWKFTLQNPKACQISIIIKKYPSQNWYVQVCKICIACARGYAIRTCECKLRMNSAAKLKNESI